MYKNRDVKRHACDREIRISIVLSDEGMPINNKIPIFFFFFLLSFFPFRRPDRFVVEFDTRQAHIDSTV